MFYGLNKVIKSLLPKQLFYRGLLIVATPIIILQITITLVFFDSLWIKTNKGLTRALVSELKTFVNAYDNEEVNKDFILLLFEENFNLDINYENNIQMPSHLDDRWFSPMDRSLRRELKSKNLNYWFDTTSHKELVDLKIRYKDGYFQFFIPKERLTSSSVRIFVFWITLPALLVISIAMIFLKNQTKPIIKLAEVSEKFGRGEEIEEFRPSGALEIRKAGFEFDRMMRRIKSHLSQRSEMLSGISHDLRTPLTRMKLQTAFINEKDISNKLTEDINEMEKMLNEYLQFTSSSYIEKDELFNLSELIKEIVEKYNNQNLTSSINERVYLNGRKNLIKRCINNLIDNALKYGKKVYVELSKKSTNVFIKIEDDGPGIPEKEYDNVFKPFYKIDKGRAETKSSVGLGLSIASDIIRSHGGNIKLEKSKLKGLEVRIFLPV